MILSNHHAYTYNFRKEIIQRLFDENYKVYIVLPYGEKVELLKEMGCECFDLPLDRRGMNPIADFKLLVGYHKIISKIKPDVVLSYTIKPNIYGGIVCRLNAIPFIPNVTGLGTAIEKRSFIQRMLIRLYRFACKDAHCVFFQNKDNSAFFLQEGFKPKKYKVIPGSGVNTKYYSLQAYPHDETIVFMFISRIMKEKGIDEYLKAAEYIKVKHPNAIFQVLGFCEGDYETRLENMHGKGLIDYRGMQDNVKEFYRLSHCVVHPTFYPEGMSNVLLEDAATGRPIITTNRSGCREIVEDGINGYVVEQRSSEDLIDKIEKFISLSYEEKKMMGLAARAKVEREFDRQIVVEAYLDEIEKIVCERAC